MLRGLPALAALSAHDRAFLRFLHRVTLPFDRVFRAHDELVVQSYGLLSLFYQETARTGTSQPEELLSAFDGFLDRTAARSELYARLKTLCELARHSGSRDAPVSATFDSLRDVLADIGVGRVCHFRFASGRAGGHRRRSIAAVGNIRDTRLLGHPAAQKHRREDSS